MKHGGRSSKQLVQCRRLTSGKQLHAAFREPCMGVTGLESHLDIFVLFGAQILQKFRSNFPINSIRAQVLLLISYIFITEQPGKLFVGPSST